MDMIDTVYAPSTAIGGAIAILRVSGPDAKGIVSILSKDITKQPRVLQFVRVLADGETVDDCMAVFFAAPHSYTGEDMAELHCHGGTQTVQKLLSLLAGCGFRPAEPGEFTRRAFLNGKMDLSQAEAVMDVIHASAERSLKAAVFQLEGGVQVQIDAVSSLLLSALSAIDAAIDYPDEAEIDTYAALPQQIAEAMEQLLALIAGGRRGRVLRDGVRAVILGKPNVGKSSLLNALLGRERAIVTPLAGTTRDVLDERTAFFGVPIRLIDTAGIHEGADCVESIGIDRAKAEMRSSDILLVVRDAAAPETQEDADLMADTAAYPRILVWNKEDLPTARQKDEDADALFVSAATGAGLDALKRRIVERTAPLGEDASCITNERHLHALENAFGALQSIRADAELDMIATDVRAALHWIGTITGADVDADVLDLIFSRFCVGK